MCSSKNNGLRVYSHSFLYSFIVYRTHTMDLTLLNRVELELVRIRCLCNIPERILTNVSPFLGMTLGDYWLKCQRSRSMRAWRSQRDHPLISTSMATVLVQAAIARHLDNSSSFFSGFHESTLTSSGPFYTQQRFWAATWNPDLTLCSPDSNSPMVSHCPRLKSKFLNAVPRALCGVALGQKKIS